jgi:hypothetical protein
VTFIDNAALGVIAGIHSRLKPSSGLTAVATAAELVARLFRQPA